MTPSSHASKSPAAEAPSFGYFALRESELFAGGFDSLRETGAPKSYVELQRERMAAIDAAYGCFRLERLEGQFSTIMTPGERK